VSLTGPVRTASVVVAVVVTWQRLHLLQEALPAVLGQDRRPDVVVVVDNASGDGTAEWVSSAHPDVDLLVLGVNTGGAGGFAAGLGRALDEHGADLVWLLDDDTVPAPGALGELVRAWESFEVRPSLVASRVVWRDGRDHPMNTPRPAPWRALPPAAALRVQGACSSAPRPSCRSWSTATSCGRSDCRSPTTSCGTTTSSSRRACCVAGWGCSCPRASSSTARRGSAGPTSTPGERFYFEVRNKVWTFLRSDGLLLPERALYAASTLQRWLRTAQRSPDRAVLRSPRPGGCGTPCAAAPAHRAGARRGRGRPCLTGPCATARLSSSQALARALDVHREVAA
jgi:hypothetical protein